MCNKGGCDFGDNSVRCRDDEVCYSCRGQSAPADPTNPDSPNTCCTGNAVCCRPDDAACAERAAPDEFGVCANHPENVICVDG